MSIEHDNEQERTGRRYEACAALIRLLHTEEGSSVVARQARGLLHTLEENLKCQPGIVVSRAERRKKRLNE